MNIFGKRSDLPFFTQERFQEGEKSGFVYAWTGYYLQPDTVERHLAWENSRHLATLPLAFLPTDVCEKSTKFPYWWRVTPHIWVVLLIGWIKYPTLYDQSEALPRSSLPRSGEWRVISTEFLRSFLRRHLAGETVVASPNVGCFRPQPRRHCACQTIIRRQLFAGHVIDFRPMKTKKNCFEWLTTNMTIGGHLHSNKR